MPKERIYDSCNLFDIEIGWAHDRDVQLGISTHDGRSLAAWLAGQEIHVPPDSPQLGDPTDAPRVIESLPQFNSLWASLDRAGINRLIKMLRKARDDAYGHDE